MTDFSGAAQKPKFCECECETDDTTVQKLATVLEKAWGVCPMLDVAESNRLTWERLAVAALVFCGVIPGSSSEKEQER